MRSAERHRAAGFTLTELLVVIVIIGILAAIGVPRLSVFLQLAKLDEAKPYLGDIASALRRSYNETRQLPVGTTDDEQALVNALGVELSTSGDFCYVVRVPAGSWLWGGGALAPDTTVPEFEVWAVLREADATTSGITGGGSCTVVGNKLARNTAWSGSSTDAFSEGRVVVLHYPPPPDGINSGLDWVNGFSVSDVTR